MGLTRSVPGFKQASGPLVEETLMLGPSGISVPGLGNHRDDHFGQGSGARVAEELEKIVEAARVRHASLDDGEEILEAVTEAAALHEGLTRAGVVDVALDKERGNSGHYRESQLRLHFKYLKELVFV